MAEPHGIEHPPTTKERASFARARSARSAVLIQQSKRSFDGLVDAAVAAGGAGPPGVVRGTTVHDALQLVHVRDEILFAAIERLLELFELRAPALHLVLAQLN